ncbi:2',3'-cyclic-nucleotide 3'-phosphodiesterase [Eucyclogobius newberryi]|uniref:2',3'-cyclic-nucleotide 3'-phosphodiesterase n=1 Tax=Eucyclogobius newberryi TaxID=166745 RepID=UPI003B58BC98
MDAEQSVEGADSPQQETQIQKDVTQAESPAEMETPAASATNGEREHVNGHAEDENEAEQAEGDAKTEETVPQEDPKAEPVPNVHDEDGVEADAGKEAENDQIEPEKPVETPVNETAPEPAVAPEPVETPPPKEEKVAENVEAQKEKEQMAELVKGGETEAKEDGKMEDGAKGAGDEKKKSDNAKELKENSDAVEVEVAPAAAAAEVKEQEEPTPAPGSLAFPILEHDKTKEAFTAARTLVVLRGLPGSGKSFLARAIADAYQDQCAVVSADDRNAKAFDEVIVAKCGGDTCPALVVVDDLNHTQDRLAQLRGIAKQHNLVAVFLEPRTEWRRDAAQLAKKTKRGLEQAKLEAMKKAHEEMSVPLYFGWFLFFTVQDKVRETSKNFLKALEVLESFKKHTSDFRGEGEEEVDLEQYFKAKGTLHCTAKFTNYGKAEGAKEYAEKQVVQDLYGSVSELSLTALFVTPRTVGARVSLSDDQLQLWPDDAEKEAEPMVPGASALPRGSRAHVTLGCADLIQPVQTGYDLLQILLLQKDGQQEQAEIDSGTVTYYGEGRWYLALKEPISATACFSSTYKPKAPGPAKKEKKKAKCTIL